MSVKDNTQNIINLVEKAYKETYFLSVISALKEKFPSHSDLKHVGPKALALNALAGTNLQMVPRQIQAMSNRIIQLNVEEKIKKLWAANALRQ